MVSHSPIYQTFSSHFYPLSHPTIISLLSTQSQSTQSQENDHKNENDMRNCRLSIEENHLLNGLPCLLFHICHPINNINLPSSPSHDNLPPSHDLLSHDQPPSQEESDQPSHDQPSHNQPPSPQNNNDDDDQPCHDIKSSHNLPSHDIFFNPLVGYLSLLFHHNHQPSSHDINSSHNLPPSPQKNNEEDDHQPSNNQPFSISNL